MAANQTDVATSESLRPNASKSCHSLASAILIFKNDDLSLSTKQSQSREPGPALERGQMWDSSSADLKDQLNDMHSDGILISSHNRRRQLPNREYQGEEEPTRDST